VTPRFRLALIAGAFALSGCGADALGPLPYAPGEGLAKELQDKPKLRDRVVQLVGQTFGETTDVIRVPPGAPIPQGGARLAANFLSEADHKAGKTETRPVIELIPNPRGGKPRKERIAGGYAIYRRQCMHCHGASGDGNGPTAPFLWPPPRDYRPGIFKFTSTSGSGRSSKPTREDLRRTLIRGIPNTSMPSFESLLTPSEVEQVIDYVIFLSIRGETEMGLVYEAANLEDQEAETGLTEETVQGVTEQVFSLWAEADNNVVDPKVPRTPSSRESVLRGRELFLGAKGLECYGCHGVNGKGNGDSFIDYDTFRKFVFDGDPDPEKARELRAVADKANKKCCSDEWGVPLRPADLTAGVYKGGRRPIDLYWRIAKGINGTPMPAHLGSLLTDDREVWDLVNFVLALPYEPELLDDARPYKETHPEAAAPAATASAGTGTSPSPGG
jgi:mono/diheme cytochrome c family protein